MPYCAQCGVEVDNGVAACPLCGFAVPVLPGVPVAVSHHPDPDHLLEDHMPPGTRRRILWQFLSLAFVLAFMAVFASDTVRNGEVTWSRLPMAIFGHLWIAATFFLLLFRHPVCMSLGLATVSCGWLALYDALFDGMSWFLPLGLPLFGMVCGAGLLLVLGFRLLGLRGFGMAALATLVLIVFCIGLDLLISGYQGLAEVRWSFIVLTTGLPVSVFFFYVHFHLRKRIDLRRLFHV